MKFFAFHLMPWDRLPADFDEKYESAWTWLPNSLYDPQHGHTLYNRYLDELVLAEELGFDGVCVNEHHQNAYGTMPSPNLMGAILARQTKRVKIAVVGNALPLYNPPTRVAEEFAMIDVISGGRLIAGLVVGGGPEYYSFSINPTHARSMYAEALDLVLRCLDRAGPVRALRRALEAQVREPLAASAAAAASADLDSRRGQQGNDRVRGRSAVTATWAFRISTSTSSRRTSTRSARPARRTATRATPSSSAGCADLRGRDRRASLGRIRAAPVYFAKNLLKGLVVLPPGYTRPARSPGSSKRPGSS